MAVVKVLKASFKGSLGKKHNLNIGPIYKDDLDEATVRKAMTDLAELKMFKQGEELIYDTPVSASIVTTTTEELYNN